MISRSDFNTFLCGYKVEMCSCLTVVRSGMPIDILYGPASRQRQPPVPITSGEGGPTVIDGFRRRVAEHSLAKWAVSQEAC